MLLHWTPRSEMMSFLMSFLERASGARRCAA
jgi:hypothetical protein